MTNGLENLERRKLMTNTLGADGVLRIVGTAGDDTITVSLAGRTVSGITSTSKKHPLSIAVSDGTTTQFFDGTTVREISFAGLAGNDKITLGKTNIRAFMNGGDGNDSLSASQGDASDTLLGGDGDDYLFGGGGNDTLNGGNGGDLMIGGTGDDYLEVKSETDTDDTALGGDGTDTVSLQTYTSGTTENIGLLNPGIHVVTDTIYGDVERVIGSAFPDHITNVSGHTLYVDGGAGDDVILLGKGNDTIIGGAGRDSINGGPGNDTIFAKDSEIDTIMGGTGHDTITRDSNDVT